MKKIKYCSTMRYLIILIINIMTLTAQGQIVIRMKRDGGVSTIPCKVNGLGLTFIFDTGASEVSMSMTEASFMLKNGYLKKEDIIGTANYQDANGNINEGITVVLREIDIAGLTLKNVKASVVKNLKAPLLLGQSALRKLGNIQLDLDSNTITINPSTIPHDPTDTIDNKLAVVDSAFREPIQLSQDEIYFQYGMEKYWAEDYSGAIKEFNEAIALNNSNAKYYLRRALAKDMLEDWKSAILDYSKTIKLDSKNSEAYGFRAETRYRMGDTTGALNDLQLAIQFDPRNSYAYRERGKIKIDRSKYKEAIADFTFAIKIEPEDYTAYYFRGVAKQKLKNFKGAIADYDTAISINDNVALYWTKRGEAKFDIENYDGATFDLDKALELDPDLGYSYTLKGLIAQVEDDLEGAIDYFEKAIELNPKDVYTALQLAFAKQELKERVWISIGFADDDVEWFMKTEVESQRYEVIQIWLKQKMKKYIHKKNGKNITYLNPYSLILTSVHCSSKKIKFEYFILYDSKGATIHSEEREYENWQIVPPGSIGESIVKNVCGRYKK